MTRLILTTGDSAAGSLKQAGLADIVIPFGIRFVWGSLPTLTELATLLAPRSAEHDLGLSLARTSSVCDTLKRSVVRISG